MNLNIKKLLFLLILLIIIFLGVLTYYLWIGVTFMILITLLYLFNKVTKKYIYEGMGGRSIIGRNFDNLLLGSTSVWKHFNKNNGYNKNLISFSFYKRNLYSDFLILKHKFSYLRKHGKVLITIDCLDLGVCSSNKLTFSDVQLFHKITLKALHINTEVNQYTLSFPLIFYPTYTLKLLISSIKGNASSRMVASEQQRNHIISILSQMIEFCLERELIPELIFINYNENQFDILGIQTEVNMKYKKVSSYLFKDIDQILEVI